MNRPRSESIAAALLAAGAGALLLLRIPAAPLLGWDSYPEILTSRILDFADFAGTFSERTAEGFYPSAFYRPLLNLSLAADYALWGIEPFGYHVTSVALYAACAIAIFWLSKRLLGDAAHWGPWTALGVFLLLPVHLEVVPIISRRMDVLCGLCSLLALGSLTPRALAPERRVALLPALFTTLAVAAKEAGVALLPLVFTLSFCLPPNRATSVRFGSALRTTALHGLAVAAVFAARFLALGELGGHPSTDLSAAFTRLPHFFGLTLARAASPVALRYDDGAGFWTFALAAAAALAIGAVALRLMRADRGSDSDPAERSELTMLAIGLVWIAGLAGIYAITGLLQPWYLFLPGLAVALGLGAIAQMLSRLRAGAWHGAASAGLLLLLLLVVAMARFSPLVIGFGHWTRGAVQVGHYLDALTERIERAPAGSVLEVAAPQAIAKADPSPVATPAATLLNAYSLPAWAELRFPKRRIEFRSVPPASPLPPPEPDALIIAIRTSARRAR